MNILILNWRDPRQPNAGGAEQVTLMHAKEWIVAGHTVWWYSSIFKGAKIEEDIDGVHIVRAGHYAGGVQIRAFFWYLFGKHQKFDLVVDQFHGLPFFTPVYVRTKKIAFIHEVAREVWWLNPWPWPFHLIPAILGTLLEPLIFKLFYTKTPFLTVSESTRDDLVACGIPANNITIIHNGVNLSGMQEKLPKKEKKNTAIFLGAISKDKGIEDALKAFAEMKKKDSTWQFWIVGKASKEMETFLRDEIKKLDLEKQTTYFGFVSQRKKFELLARAHLMINPSIHEGWGLVNIEANAVGTPVVAYNVHGSKDSIKNGKTGVLVKKGNYSDFATQSLLLIVNRTVYEVMRRNCISWSKNFVWKKIQKRSLQFITTI